MAEAKRISVVKGFFNMRLTITRNTISLVSLVASISAILVSFFGVYIQLKSSINDSNKIEYENIDMIRTYNLKIMQIILDAIESKDNRKQIIAYRLALTIEDQKLSNILVGALESSGNPLVKSFIRKRENIIVSNKSLPAKSIAKGSTKTDHSVVNVSSIFCANYPEQEFNAKNSIIKVQSRSINYVSAQNFDLKKFSIDKIEGNKIYFNEKDREAAEEIGSEIIGFTDISFSMNNYNLPKGQILVFFCGPTFDQVYGSL
jgi:hypothetical protein